MSEMIERVAEGLWNAEGVAFGWLEHERGVMNWAQAVEHGVLGVTVFRIFARAAIQAQREPTEAMIAAGKSKIDFHEWIVDPCASEQVAAAWSAMSDEALNPAPPTGREGE